MTDNFIPFARPEIGEDEINSVVKCLKSGWLTSGPIVKEFENKFSEFLKSDTFSISVNSATAGLHLALEALDIGEGDEVITTTHTFTATAEVIRYLGADPVFVDIDKNTFCIDTDLIEKSITKKTKAIMPVHFAGMSAEMDQIIKIAKKYDLKVIEDSAHALPCTFKGDLIGTLDSDAVVFSFYANKTMTTGEGGMVVTKNKQIAERIKLMRLHGINKDSFDRFTSNISKWKYDVVAPGFKYNMTDIAASIGINQLKKIYQFQERRKKIANIYYDALKDLDIKLPIEKYKSDIHSWHLYVIQLDNSLDRDDFMNHLFSKGIGCSVHYTPLHLLSYWKSNYKLNDNMFPNSTDVFHKSVSLPIYPSLKEYEIEKVIETVRKYLKNV